MPLSFPTKYGRNARLLAGMASTTCWGGAVGAGLGAAAVCPAAGAAVGAPGATGGAVGADAAGCAGAGAAGAWQAARLSAASSASRAATDGLAAGRQGGRAASSRTVVSPVLVTRV